jgi:hypothetical protein
LFSFYLTKNFNATKLPVMQEAWYQNKNCRVMHQGGYMLWSARASGRQVLETVNYFINLSLAWLPLLSDFVLDAPSGKCDDFLVLCNGLPVLWMLGLS